MMILKGAPVAQKIYLKLRGEIALLKLRPLLAVVLVGENPASLTYIRVKEKIAKDLNVGFKLYHFPEIISQKELKKLLNDLGKNKSVTGILVQLPLPASFDTEEILKKIPSQKDVDGFYGPYPAPTAQAILDILKFYHVDYRSKNIVLVGHGRLVGEPLAEIFKKQNIQVTICDSKTPDLKDKVMLADILISATGVPGLIKPEMIKKGVVLIDAGTSEAGGKLMGDIDPACVEKASAYTPTPCGVGPVTVAELMKNLVQAAKEQN